jgi:hypothetical protein
VFSAWQATLLASLLQKNHLSGLQRKLLKVSFYNSQQLAEVKREVAPIASRNRAKSKTTAAYSTLHRGGGASQDQHLGAALLIQVSLLSTS